MPHIIVDNHLWFSRNNDSEAQAAPRCIEAIEGWAPNRKHLEFFDARGIALQMQLPSEVYPLTSKNDMLLILRQYSK